MGCVQDKCHSDGNILISELKSPMLKTTISRKIVTSKSNIRDYYTFKKVLGTGGFAQVKLAQQKIQKESALVAIKIIEKELIKSKMDYFQKEMENLIQLDHPNIIKFHEFYEDEKFFYIVQEYCSGGELLQKVLKFSHFPEDYSSFIMEKLFLAVSHKGIFIKIIPHMHQCGIVHRDLKPENVLFVDESDNSKVKIIDFGLSNKFKKQKALTLQVGTPLYVSPQVIQGRYDEKCDIWALGVIMYVLLSGLPPFYGDTKEEIYEQILQLDVNKFEETVWENVSNEAKDLIIQLLDKDENQRISIKDALNHNWFTKFQQQMEKFEIVVSKQEEGNVLNQLIHFKGQSLFQKEIMKVFINQLNKEETKNLQAIFEAIDLDRTGLIRITELKNAIKRCNIDIKDEEIEKIFEMLGTHEIHGEKIIRYTEFITAIFDKRKYLTEEKLWALFKYIDKADENDNYINAKDLHEIFIRQGQDIPIEKIEKMIQEVCPLEQIDFDTFKQLMQESRCVDKMPLAD